MAISYTDNMGPQRPQKLTRRHGDALRQFLVQDVGANLFALSWLENHGIQAKRPGHYAFWGWFDEHRKLRAMALNISNRLLMLDTRQADDARRFARFFGGRQIRFDHVVSRARSVDPFWAAYVTAHEANDSGSAMAARLIQHQRLYQLRPTQLNAPKSPQTSLRPARRGELDAVFLASVRMHREETLEDPLTKNAAGFRRHVRHRIDHERTFVIFDDHHRLMFKADISTRCSAGAQISGVYTAPQFRNQGIATGAMADLCTLLFDSGLPRVTLYVNRENQPAIRVYERLGFDFLAPYRTVFVAN